MTLRQRGPRCTVTSAAWCAHGFLDAWNAYLCAMQGHMWTWQSYNTGGPPPSGRRCSRCGAFSK